MLLECVKKLRKRLKLISQWGAEGVDRVDANASVAHETAAPERVDGSPQLDGGAQHRHTLRCRGVQGGDVLAGDRDHAQQPRRKVVELARRAPEVVTGHRDIGGRQVGRRRGQGRACGAEVSYRPASDEEPNASQRDDYDDKSQQDVSSQGGLTLQKGPSPKAHCTPSSGEPLTGGGGFPGPRGPADRRVNPNEKTPRTEWGSPPTSDGR